MDVSLDEIEQAGLKRRYDGWQADRAFCLAYLQVIGSIITAFMALLTSIFTPVPWLYIGTIWFVIFFVPLCYYVFANYQVRYRISAEALKIIGRRQELFRLEQGLSAHWSLNTERDLKKAKFKKIRSRAYRQGKDAYLSVFEGKFDRVTSARDYIIRIEDINVAVASVLAVANSSIWKKNSADELLDGALTHTIQQAIAGSQIDLCLQDANHHSVEVVCVGLESYPPQEPLYIDKSLSKSRARALVRVMHSPEFTWYGNPNIRILGLDMGKAITPSKEDSHIEQRQRSAIIIAVSRIQSEDYYLPFNEALTELVKSSSIIGTKLSEFLNADKPIGEILFSGSDRSISGSLLSDLSGKT